MKLDDLINGKDALAQLSDAVYAGQLGEPTDHLIGPFADQARRLVDGNRRRPAPQRWNART
ncbi:hypothetical protein OG943_38070 [Amycolatopsis sp. NBC_00345]|uniref:hypothetical protein n=1 Tax=Amycolatopsis sp. NBC_00345 TaxID=2975955 RepID=UPI002E27509A